MPTSSCGYINVIVRLVLDLKPKRILDIGPGWGTYGLLFRQSLDMCNQEAYAREDWQTEIIGIEVFEGYRTPLWDYAYNEVLIGDAVELAPEVGRCDLVLLGGVIEHLPKDKGMAFLDSLLSQCTYAILSTPYGHMTQEAAYGNEAERHLSGWSKRDFRKYHMVYRECLNGFVVLVSKSPIPRRVGRSTSHWVLARVYLARRLPMPIRRAYRRMKSLFTRSRR
jgi:hypothetical protein